jgi:DNA invertase Pin-like site-specific DNA recombinase
MQIIDAAAADAEGREAPTEAGAKKAKETKGKKKKKKKKKQKVNEDVEMAAAKNNADELASAEAVAKEIKDRRDTVVDDSDEEEKKRDNKVQKLENNFGFFLIDFFYYSFRN